MPELLTLYTAKVCPFAHRVELALAEANVEYQSYQIDLTNKPIWYASKVNPVGKIPAIAYGGPRVPADQPSPQSFKISESLVLTEFVAEVYADANLIPKDPVQRAKVRFFMDAAANKFEPLFFGYTFTGSVDQAGLIKGLEEFQTLLPKEGYAVGEWSIADAVVTPFVGRLFLALENDLGRYPVGEGPKTLEIIKTDPKLERIRKYMDDVTSRESFMSTFDKPPQPSSVNIGYSYTTNRSSRT
ncbi:hypothetical protein BXZ70DRAFT_998347 [Cristinia sonorae]|uniref:GST N-terminal domain-containing protein n=1 Tax=Cristinia sonorae TaxID=1940300 RepID=A0A8K0UUZ6_9AGAR|nr:hypothetical protein BXZ70DRAFT_998347 [Cristinia sonorae]